MPTVLVHSDRFRHSVSELNGFICRSKRCAIDCIENTTRTTHDDTQQHWSSVQGTPAFRFNLRREFIDKMSISTNTISYNSHRLNLVCIVAVKHAAPTSMYGRRRLQMPYEQMYNTSATPHVGADTFGSHGTIHIRITGITASAELSLVNVSPNLYRVSRNIRREWVRANAIPQLYWNRKICIRQAEHFALCSRIGRK